MTGVLQRHGGWSLFVAAALLSSPGTGVAQAEPVLATVTAERENLRASPQGTILAEVQRGTALAIGESRDDWRQATIEGWIWSASLRPDTRDGHDVAVSANGGENLRAEPNGEILARARTGMLFERLGTEGNWTRVRRTAWIWGPSLDLAQGSIALSGPQSPGTAAPTGSAARQADAARTREFVAAGSRGLVVLDQPAGDTLARIRHGGAVEILAREGDWARVRVEGWTFTAAVASDDGEAGVLRDISRSQLARDPNQYRGRLIEWDVQFIALQSAERFRTDFLEGEPFILARGPGDDPGFVYVAVPPERIEEVRRLVPLQRIRILSRIRTPRSALTDAPVSDLLEILSHDTRTRNQP